MLFRLVSWVYLCFMKEPIKTSLHKHFESFPDYRISRNKKHLLVDIIILSIVAVLCGAESWDSIETFGKTKEKFLRKFLRLPGGIPSHDTINCVFSNLRPELFERMFIRWVSEIRDGNIKREVVSLDGKTVRGSKDGFHGRSPIHMVSAWASDNQLVLGQLKVDDKENEITAIPELLDLLDIRGRIITIDAMGAQTAIAEKIVDGGADYILAVKGNHRDLLDQIRGRFDRQHPCDSDLQVDKGHGRLESRKCDVIRRLDFIDSHVEWKAVRSVVRITATRDNGNKATSETRYYISSLDEGAADMNQFIRQHWGIENQLHWSLDMVFNEDRQRKRAKNAANNFSYIRKIALNTLRKDKSKGSLVTKRLRAGWDEKFLLELFNQI